MKKLISIAMSALLLAGTIGAIHASALVPPPEYTGHYCSKSVTMDMTYYKEATEYFSGPASALQAISYITGEKPAHPDLQQWNYALKMVTNPLTGTSSSAMLKLLNGQQNKVTYSAVKAPSYDAFIDYIDQSLVKNVPVILKVPYEKGLKIQSHYLCINGQTTMEGMRAMYVLYDVTDPDGTENGKYTTMDSIYFDLMKDPDQTLFCAK